MSGAWIATLAFTVVLATVTLWYRRILAVAVPENRAPFVAAMGAGAALGVAALVQGVGWLGGSAAVIAIVGGGMFFLLFMISEQKGGAGQLVLGEPIPDFNAPDDSGNTFEISSLAGNPFLLKFFRGHW